MIRVENETEGFLLSKTKNCETLIQQTHRKTEETLKFKIIKARDTFHSNPPNQIRRD